MYAVMGITGQVGGAVARALLESGKAVRGIIRDPSRATGWERKGVEMAVAVSEDAEALTRAFQGTEGVFVMMPPYFAPSPDLREARTVTAAVTRAVLASRVPKVVALSTVGAHRESELGILEQVRMFERGIRALSVPTTALRPAWFMENAAWDIESARTRGEISSFLTPVSRPIPMVATSDVGSTAASLLQESWTGGRVVELEGPEAIAPDDLARALGMVLERNVSAVPVARDQWDARFRSQGLPDPALRMQMLDGFNSGWIRFEGAPCQHRVGSVPLSTVISGLVLSQAGRTG
jgi:uncharacterized protein YbjT (DUF2867 family)